MTLILLTFNIVANVNNNLNNNNNNNNENNLNGISQNANSVSSNTNAVNTIGVTVLPIPGKRSLRFRRFTQQCPKTDSKSILIESVLDEIRSLHGLLLNQNKTCQEFQVCTKIKEHISKYKLYDVAILELQQEFGSPSTKQIDCHQLFPDCTVL